MLMIPDNAKKKGGGVRVEERIFPLPTLSQSKKSDQVVSGGLNVSVSRDVYKRSYTSLFVSEAAMPFSVCVRVCLLCAQPELLWPAWERIDTNRHTPSVPDIWPHCSRWRWVNPG